MKKRKVNPAEYRYSDDIQKQDDLVTEGVGRAGAPLNPLPLPGITKADLTRIRNMHMSRLRIDRPGEDK
jgi:hypothetical protein